MLNKARINKNDLETGLLTVSNIDGEDTVVEFNTRKTVCFVRAGVLEDEIGIALLTSFERPGAFMVNNKEGMLTCDNKMSRFYLLKEIVFLHLKHQLSQMRKV